MSHDKIASGNVFYFYTVFYEKITVQGYKLVINSDSQHIKDILRILLMICRTMAWDLLIRNTQRLLNLVQEQDKALAVTLSVLVRALKVKSVIWLMVRYRADSHWTGALVLISALLLYQVECNSGEKQLLPVHTGLLPLCWFNGNHTQSLWQIQLTHHFMVHEKCWAIKLYIIISN